MPSSGVRTRSRLKKRDRRELEAILRSVGVFSRHEITAALQLVEDALVNGSASDYEFMVAEVDKQIAGFVCFGHVPCTEGSYNIHWLAVSPPWQRCGVGALLLEGAEDKGKTGRLMYVEISSRENYASARFFYRASGYTRATTVPDFYAPGDDKHIYVKDLAGRTGLARTRAAVDA